jgi:DNA end-binding protein Ku
VIDLMEALRASLQKRSPAAAQPAESKARKEPKRAAQAAAPAKRAARK